MRERNFKNISRYAKSSSVTEDDIAAFAKSQPIKQLTAHDNTGLNHDHFTTANKQRLINNFQKSIKASTRITH